MQGMVTPTCNTCKAKFPGREICKKCGADPNGKPVLATQVRISSENFQKGMRDLAKAFNKLGEALAPHAQELSIYERRQIRAHLRSIQNKPQKRAHGRTRGR